MTMSGNWDAGRMADPTKHVDVATARSEASDDADDDHGQVIVSLDVFAAEAIDELSGFEATVAGQSDGRRYELGTITLFEEDADRRADALDHAVSTLIGILAEVSREALFAEGTFVRLFVTFGAGAQTLSASLVQRIAAVNATVWIDS